MSEYYHDEQALMHHPSQQGAPSSFNNVCRAILRSVTSM